MIIEYEGERFPFEFDDIGIKAAIKIEKHTGLSLTEWGDSLAPDEAKGQKMNLISLQALGWLVLYGGEGEVDDADFKLVKLGDAFNAALLKLAEEQKAKEAAERPTGAGPASNGQTAAPGRKELSPLSSVPASP